MLLAGKLFKDVFSSVLFLSYVLQWSRAAALFGIVHDGGWQNYIDGAVAKQYPLLPFFMVAPIVNTSSYTLKGALMIHEFFWDSG